MSDKTKQDCEICCETYDLESKKLVKCKHCDLIQCQVCIQTYLLSLGQLEASCMGCNIEWKYDYLQCILPKNFLKKEYKNYQKNLIWDIEKGKYPQVMTEIQKQNLQKEINTTYLQKKNLMGTRERELFVYYMEFKMEYTGQKSKCTYVNCVKKNVFLNSQGQCMRCRQFQCTYCFQMKDMDLDHSSQCLRNETQIQRKNQKIEIIQNLEQNIKETEEKLNKLQEQRCKSQVQPNKQKQEISKPKYVEACPINSCRGYLNDQFVCEICQTEVCKNCGIQKNNDQHECKQEDINTQKLKKQGSKQCPKCHILIFKISGCNHFFCTQCKASFDWVTLKPITNNTNPHYYEYMRNNPNLQVRHVDLCQEVQNVSLTCGQVLQNIRKYPEFRKYLDKITQEIRLIDHVQLEINQITMNLRLIDNLDINIKFIKNEMDEIQYQKLLLSRRKRAAKYKNFIQVLELYRRAGKTIYTDMLRAKQYKEALRQQIIQLDQLAKTAKKLFEQKVNDFGSKSKKSEILEVQDIVLQI